MRPGAMLGSSVWVVSRRWVRLVVWRSVCVACSGILGALVGAGVLLAAVCPPFCPWGWCRRWVAACVRLVPLCVAVVVGVGVLGAW